MNRRQFLSASASVACATGVGARASASTASDRRFLFVFAPGGWDTTRVLSPEFDNPNVSMERSADPWSVGGLSLVDARSRPSVRTFFEQYASSVSVLDGMLVPSVAHEVCSRIVMTGSTRDAPDWAALLAGVDASRFVIPNLVIDAPSYPAGFGIAVARAGSNGQLDALIDGSMLAADDAGVALPSTGVQGAIDRYLGRRAAALAGTGRTASEQALLDTWGEAVGRATALQDARHAVAFGSAAGFEAKIGVALGALSTGLSRCVSLAFPEPNALWDSHSGNDEAQSALWETLFAGLLNLQDQLAITIGPSGRPLADDVVVVVLSEMGRTPKLNAAGGKDHWPYTSAMLWGSGVAGGRQVGDYNELFQGSAIDLLSGEPNPDGVVPAASHLGATLLALADEDPAQWVPGHDPIGALIA